MSTYTCNVEMQHPARRRLRRFGRHAIIIHHETKSARPLARSKWTAGRRVEGGLRARNFASGPRLFPLDLKLPKVYEHSSISQSLHGVANALKLA